MKIKINEAHFRAQCLTIAAGHNEHAKPSEVLARASKYAKWLLGNGLDDCGCKDGASGVSKNYDDTPTILAVPYNIARTKRPDESAQFLVTVFGAPFAVIDTAGLDKGSGRCVLMVEGMRESELHGKVATLAELTSSIAVAISLWAAANPGEVKAKMGLT